jgi:transposase
MMTQTPSHDLLAENALLKEQIRILTEQIEWFKKQLFGKCSEKAVDLANANQLIIPGLEPIEEGEPKTQLVPTHTRKKPERNGQDKITLPEDLPVERQIIDLTEDEKICKETGLPLVKIGEEITRKLAIRIAKHFIKEIVRPKYAKLKSPEGGILIAPLPESLLERCQADESFLADMLVKKFCDHLPLYRQSEILSREGILISRQILSQWTLRSAMALKPLKDLMMKIILETGNVFIDETPIGLQERGKGKIQQAYMWVMVGGTIPNPYYRVYDFYRDRKHSNVIQILKGYDQVLHSDKYAGYETLASQKQIIWCPCFVHIRRKFIEAESGDSDFRNWVLRKIKYLYMFERVAWARSPEERLRIRQEKEEPIIDELITAIKNKLIHGKVLPKSKFKEALGYFVSLIPYLKNYTLHPWARLDNNVAERAVRPLAIGRKNWLFVGSKEGGEAAAIIFSLVQTCRAININPRDYLEDVMRRIMSYPINRLEELLPDEWALNKGLIEVYDPEF